MEAQNKKPLFVFGTRHGTIFNITPSHQPNIPGIQLSVGDFHDFKQTLKMLPEGMTFNKFLGYGPDTCTYLSAYDFYKKEGMTGCERETVVKIKCSKGYTEFTAATYDEVAELIQPTYLVTLTEYPASQKGHSSQSNKSIKRAINKTTSYLQKSKLAKERPKGIKLLAAVHGGKNASLLNRSLEQILKHEIDGFVICDVCESQTLAEREEIYTTIKKRLAEEDQKDKQYVLALGGMGKLEDIAHAMKFGISIFEVNYPFAVAEQQKALIRNADGTYTERQPTLKKDMEPLDPKCGCYTCTRHSESYIAHLINCFEMNAKVLLSIHNLQNYIDFMNKF